MMSVTARLVAPDEFLALMRDARFLRTSSLTGVMGGRYFYVERAPEDVYPFGIAWVDVEPYKGRPNYDAG
jgi:hypothetical protein